MDLCFGNHAKDLQIQSLGQLADTGRDFHNSANGIFLGNCVIQDSKSSGLYSYFKYLARGKAELHKKGCGVGLQTLFH